MTSDSSIYSELNKVSNDEFENIMTIVPVETLLNVTIQKDIKQYKSKIDENNFIVEDNSGNEQNVYVKYITLVDFLKYLIGKYKNDNLSIMPCSSSLNEDSGNYEKYINVINNYAYVDSFFYYLTNVIKKEFNFVHGIHCYDQFVCQKNNCQVNISDDLEYLCETKYFIENMGKQFYFEDSNHTEIFKRMQEERLNIDYSNEELSIAFDDINGELSQEDCCENLAKNTHEQDDQLIHVVDQELTDGECLVMKSKQEDDSESEGDEYDSESENDEDDSESEGDEDDSESEGDEHDSGSEDEDDSGSEDEDDSGSDEDDEGDEDEMILKINKIPTQVVVMEKCDKTLDSLLDQGCIKIEELESAICQIVITLFVYQKLFGFTHNDLHTNNVMYVSTDIPFLVYKIMGKTYKIPTFGKIYKIIDFGRSIYNYKDTLLCSDSFSQNGTAHTQYNFGPFFNPEKKQIKPNKSFDLCRLACSIFDFICDDINQIDEYRNIAPVYDLIFSWLYDDKNRNILYKSNGDDKYPGFKLYKMISRIVHNHLPENQFNHKVFEKFRVESFESENGVAEMDVDSMSY